MSNMRKKIYISIAIALSLMVLFIGWISIQLSGDKILKNTYVNDIQIGGLSKEQAKDKLQNVYKLENVEVTYLDKKWSLNNKEIDFSYNLDKTIKNAYNINRQSNFMDNLEKTIISNFGKKNNLTLSINYKKDKLEKELEKLSKEINVKMKDASINISKSQVEIIDGKSGLNLNIQESIKNIIRELEKGNKIEELVVTKIEPNINKDQLKEVDTLLGSHSTSFNSSVYGRSINIKLATDRTSDVLLMPGEEFSYNDHTGMRTVSNGYKNAPVIVQGVVQEGVGGGVCQVSSTLYNSVLYAGLELVDIKNHSIPSSYVPKGRDATVTDGGVDFVFKNNLKYPVYIKNYVSGNIITCQIYGSSKDKQNIQIITNTDSVSVAPIKKVDDPTIQKGKEKELESGRNGYTVSTYREYIDSNGKVIKKEKVATSYYPKKQGVIAVGTMEVKPEQPEVKPPTTPEQPEVQPPTKPEQPDVQPPTKPEQPEVQPPTKPEQPENPSTPPVVPDQSPAE